MKLVKTKKCSKCKLEKPIRAFGKLKKAKDGLRYQCKECRKSEKSRTEYKHKWYVKNKKRHNAKSVEYNKKNKHTRAWRGLIRRCIQFDKTEKTQQILGYSSNDFKCHIESLWTKGMLWSNYGEWHIDHIIPAYLFPPDTHPSIANHLNNLRPLWATTRIIDGIQYEGNLNRSKDCENKNIELSNKPKTIILDIDGCILRHLGDMCKQLTLRPPKLKGVVDRFIEWDKKGHRIILLTGRRESARNTTEQQLRSLGLFWDHLVMGAPPGQRVLINDLKPDSFTATAVAINLKRNEGLENTDLDNAIKLQTLAIVYGIDLEI